MTTLPAHIGIIKQINAGFRHSIADDLRDVNLKIDTKRAEVGDLLRRLRSRREELAPLLARRAQLCDELLHRFDSLADSRQDEADGFVDNDWDGMG